MSDRRPADEEPTYRAAPGYPRYHPERGNSRQAFEERVRQIYRGPWGSGALLLLYTALLVLVLGGTTPLVALVFPGMLLAVTLEVLITQLAGWDFTTNRRLLSMVPLCIYFVLTSTVMFVARSKTGEGAYRDAGILSLFFTVPYAVLIALALMRQWRHTEQHP